MGCTVNIFTGEHYYWWSIWPWEAQTNDGGVARVRFCWRDWRVFFLLLKLQCKLTFCDICLQNQKDRVSWQVTARQRFPRLYGNCFQCHIESSHSITMFWHFRKLKTVQWWPKGLKNKLFLVTSEALNWEKKTKNEQAEPVGAYCTLDLRRKHFVTHYNCTFYYTDVGE